MTAVPNLFARKMDFPFQSAGVPRYWMANHPVATYISNGLNVLFPAGERFFIRSVRAHLDQLDDAELKSRARGFMAQEVRHGMEHERFFEILDEQGFDVQSFLAWYTHLAYEVIEPRTSPALRLAVTTALEHYTALFGELALTHGIEFAHESVEELLMWHAAEEIEHKSVAFDVFEAVDGRYSVRVLALFLATAGLLGFWGASIVHFHRKDDPDARASAWAKLRGAKRLQTNLAVAQRQSAILRTLIRGFVEYMSPTFHPDNHDNYELAESYLRGIGRLDS